MYKEHWNKMGVLLETNPELINVRISHYENGEPECIDVTLHYRHKIVASVSMFLDEPIDSEVVFTIHRDKTLLVADSLPIDELVERIKTAIKNVTNMFTSNQELKISGEFSDISMALNFALKLSEQDRHLSKSERERGCKILFQLTDDKYCIGWGFKDVPSGWTEYQFDFDVDIVSKIIEQYLKKLTPVNAEDSDVMFGDGGTKDGFIMKCPWVDGEYDNENDIHNKFYCIVYFQKFVNYYAK